MKAITPIRWFIGLMVVALLLNCLPAGAQNKVIRKQRPVKTAPTKAKPKTNSPKPKTNSSKPRAQSKPANFSPTGNISGHGYVDLGLSVKWATCNVGASSPEGYGDYFAWGETNTKSSYDIDNSKIYGKQMDSICGDSNYDAATVNWGSSWRLPTKAEIDELLAGCTYTWTTRNGVEGGVFKSKKNCNAIFVPAAGCRLGTSLLGAGSYGNVWSGSPLESYADDSSLLDFISSDADWYWGVRYGGRSVRPVAE